MSTNSPTAANPTDAATQATSAFHQSSGRQALVDWVMEHVLAWEEWRKQEFDQRWQEYWRKWRGIWSEEDRTRGSERSRLISPALQQAVEESSAELEEAALGEKEGWFDLDNDNHDVVKENWQLIRRQLLDDMDLANVPGALVECILNGALCGTMIGKVVPDLIETRKLKSYLINAPKTDEHGKIVDGTESADQVLVTLEAVRPDQFVIDTAVNKPGREGIAQALGMAHRLPKPRHELRAKMHDEETDADGNPVKGAESTYFEVPLTEGTAALVKSGERQKDAEDANLLTEYHGLVPQALYDAAMNDSDAPGEYDTRKMVEAVVTIVDDKWLAACRENTNLKVDRDFLAAPVDLIPGSFWGRGIAEKGFNSQKALDAMLRALIDGIGYTVHPMLAVNAQRRDPRHKIVVGPGKVLYVNGPPQEALFPLNFGRIDPQTFTMSGELERLIQTGTGTAGSAPPPRAARGATTLGGMSLISGGLAKRTKRTLRLLERHFLLPLIEKFTLRHMQYNPDVYPFIDLKFRVRTGMSMVAREVENENLAQILQTVPPGSPMYYLMLGLIVNNTSLKDKEAVKTMVQGILEGKIPGTSEQQQPDPMAQERAAADLQEVQSRTRLKDVTTAEKVVKIKQLEGLMNGKPTAIGAGNTKSAA